MCRVALAVVVLLAFAAARADERLVICYNYGCSAQASVTFSEAQLDRVRRTLERSPDAFTERVAIAWAVGRMYFYAGQQAPIWRDRGGNYDDDGVEGRMDCIDHATNTSASLKIFERRGWLKFHSVLPSVDRGIFAVHRGARIRERPGSEEFIVDSWFFDNGDPAAVFTLAEWLKGARANGK